jgi:F-type H+-transporting ATPase subunit epsilon
MNTGALRLTIATPSQVWLDGVEVISLRAEDASGSFGIRTGHADFVTQLTSSVVRWTGQDNVPRYCAVSGGVLLVLGGATVSIACREAIMGDSLEGLEAVVRRRHADADEAARRARVDLMRLHARAVRQILRYLRPRAGSDSANPTATGRSLQ